MAIVSQSQTQDTPVEALRCTVESRGTTRIITVEGEIDLATDAALRRAFREAFQGDHETLVADLSGVTFTDSTGVHAVLDVQQRCRAQGIRFVIVPPAEDVLRPFRLAGVDRLLTFTASAAGSGR